MTTTVIFCWMLGLFVLCSICLNLDSARPPEVIFKERGLECVRAALSHAHTPNSTGVGKSGLSDLVKALSRISSWRVCSPAVLGGVLPSSGWMAFHPLRSMPFQAFFTFRGNFDRPAGSKPAGRFVFFVVGAQLRRIYFATLSLCPKFGSPTEFIHELPILEDACERRLNHLDLPRPC
jgi:hypothetical protein